MALAAAATARLLISSIPNRAISLQRYRLVSTWDRVPTDQDLFDTISRGMPGSAMPSWEHLTTDQRWGLVYYIKSLAENRSKSKLRRCRQLTAAAVRVL